MRLFSRTPDSCTDLQHCSKHCTHPNPFTATPQDSSHDLILTVMKFLLTLLVAGLVSGLSLEPQVYSSHWNARPGKRNQSDLQRGFSNSHCDEHHSGARSLAPSARHRSDLLICSYLPTIFFSSLSNLVCGLLVISVVCFVFMKVPFYGSRWLGTCCVDHVDKELADPPVPMS